MNELISMAQILMAFLIGFILGCVAADYALKKKTGKGIEAYLPYDKKTLKPLQPNQSEKPKEETTI